MSNHEEDQHEVAVKRVIRDLLQEAIACLNDELDRDYPGPEMASVYVGAVSYFEKRLKQIDLEA